VRFHHITEHGKAVFDLMYESSGTRNLLFLAGLVMNILSKGLTLVIDELDTVIPPQVELDLEVEFSVICGLINNTS
jgi:AAA15 family ATPase/GTPase